MVFCFLRMRPNFFCRMRNNRRPNLQLSLATTFKKHILQINNWRDNFVITNIAELKYVVAVIPGAYSKTSTSCKINLQSFVSWDVWKIRNTNCSF